MAFRPPQSQWTRSVQPVPSDGQSAFNASDPNRLVPNAQQVHPLRAGVVKWVCDHWEENPSIADMMPDWGKLRKPLHLQDVIKDRYETLEEYRRRMSEPGTPRPPWDACLC